MSKEIPSASFSTRVKKLFSLLIFSFLIIGTSLQAQDTRLAQQYYNSGEYEKAEVMYKRLYDSQQNNDSYFNKYIDCLLAQDKFDKAEKVIKREIDSKPTNVQLYVNLGSLLERKGELEEAEKIYRDAIENLPPRMSIGQKLARSFARIKKFDLAIETYEKASSQTDKPEIFQYSLADLYRQKGDKENMIICYLNYGVTKENGGLSLKNTFQRFFDEGDYALLKAELYKRLQQEPDQFFYSEMLEWVFINEKDYKKALRQARAFERQSEGNGSRVYNVSTIAMKDKDYRTAIKGYQYIVDNQGVNSSYYIDAKRFQLKCQQALVVENYNYQQADLDSLVTLNEQYLVEIGRNWQSAQIMIDYADFQALYLNDVGKAIELLEEVISFSRVHPKTKSRSKIALGDYYLISGDIWEASLLYSQVDKAFKEGAIGELARYKNARLSYFNGDFEWAQAQFDILKSATSKLISNDAIDQSVFIMDNMALDTTDVPLKMFAQAELLIFQKNFKDAFAKLDSITNVFPKHSLQDDIYYVKAHIYKERKQLDDAIASYDLIIENHKEEIRCDNAIFELATIYEEIVEDKEKAKALYETLFIDFDNSTLAVEARKRFRILRGDQL